LHLLSAHLQGSCSESQEVRGQAKILGVTILDLVA